MQPPFASRDLLCEPQPGDRWMVVAAHPDDETFVCGSMIAAAVAAGARVHVVCCSRGELGESVIALPAGSTLADVRDAEVREAAAFLGASIEVLHFADSGFDGTPAPGSLCAEGVEAVAAALGECMVREQPDVVVVLNPMYRNEIGQMLAGRGLNIPLMAAGLGMMASRSPYLGQAIGEGGLQGLQTYSGEQKQALAKEKTEADIEHSVGFVEYQLLYFT